ncbi:MAG: polyamine ABC transporter substrate-binding protein [Hyphomicrobium sp.]
MWCPFFGDPVEALQRHLKILNWSEYIDESILSDFTKETGIKVLYDVFDSNDLLETKLLTGGIGYDIVVPSGAYLSREISAGAFQKLDKSKLPNLSNMWEEISQRTAVFDPDNSYSINYMWGTTGIGYNEAKIKERLPSAPFDSWDLVFKPEIISKFKDCGIYFIDAPDDILPAALNYLSLDPNSSEPEALKKAVTLLETIRPNILKFTPGDYIGALADGDICLAVGYSGDILQAQARAEEAQNGQIIKYSLPREGAQMYFDQMAIPKDAENVEEAHVFLNYLMKPEVIAKASNYIKYANGNRASQAFLDPQVKDNVSIYPKREIFEHLYVMKTYDKKTQRLVLRQWTKILLGQ